MTYFFTYTIENMANGKTYVGYTNNIYVRWRAHIQGYNYKCYPIQNAIRKYGAAAFRWSIVGRYESEGCAKAEEIRLIAELKTNVSRYGDDHGYNLTDGGEGCCGLKHSPEAREKNRQSKLGKKASEQTKAKMRATMLEGIANGTRKVPSNKGATFTDEHRAKISASNTGKKNSPEHIEKIRAANLGKKQSPEAKAKQIAAQTGKPCSEETKAKISEANKGRYYSPERIEKAAAKLRGRKQSPETIAKRAAAIKKAWDRRKANRPEPPTP